MEVHGCRQRARTASYGAVAGITTPGIVVLRNATAAPQAFRQVLSGFASQGTGSSCCATGHLGTYYTRAV